MSSGPEYRQVAANLYDSLCRGEWQADEKIPSIADLMERYHVTSLNTIRHAQALLIEKGYLRAVQGVGVFVVTLPPPAEIAASEARAEVCSAIDALTRALAQLNSLAETA